MRSSCLRRADRRRAGEPCRQQGGRRHQGRAGRHLAAVEGCQGRHRLCAERARASHRAGPVADGHQRPASVAAREIAGLKLTATGKADAANPAANVPLTGNVAGQALQGSAVLATADGKSAINGLLLSLGKNRISGDLALDEKFVPVGTVTLDLPDIGPLAALALEKAEGDVRGTIGFSKNGEARNVAIKATTASISRGDITAKAVAIDALIANYLAAPVDLRKDPRRHRHLGRHRDPRHRCRSEARRRLDRLFRRRDRQGHSGARPRAASRSPTARRPSNSLPARRPFRASRRPSPRPRPSASPTARRRSTGWCSTSAAARRR